MILSLRGTNNSKTTHYLLLYIFWLSALKSVAKAPTANVLRVNTLRDIKATFSTPKRYEKNPCHFIWDSSHWGKAVKFITFSGSTTGFSLQNQNTIQLNCDVSPNSHNHKHIKKKYEAIKSRVHSVQVMLKIFGMAFKFLLHTGMQLEFLVYSRVHIIFAGSYL